MRIVAVMVSLPLGPKAVDGDSTTAYWLLEEFRRRGHSVSVAYYFDRTIAHLSDEEISSSDQALVNNGYASVIRIPCFEEAQPHWREIEETRTKGISRIMRHLRLRIRDHRKKHYLADTFTTTANSIPGDVIFCYGNATEKLTGKLNKPVAAWLTNTDKPHNTLQIEQGFRSFYGSKRLAMLLLPITDWFTRKALRRAALNYQKLMVPTHFYADDWQEILGSQTEVKALHCPADDELGEVLRSDPYEPPQNKPIRVVMLGHLRATLTTANLYFFVNEIIPALKSRDLMDQFEFHIIGKYADQPHKMVADKLEEPNIKRLGFVENLAEAVNSADILLHATPNPPGAGMRLSTCSSVAAAMVLHRCVEDAHRPEYTDGENCLFAETGDEFVDAMLAISNDPLLSKKLRENTRKTYEEMFTLKSCVDRVESLIYDAAEASLGT